MCIINQDLEPEQVENSMDNTNTTVASLTLQSQMTQSEPIIDWLEGDIKRALLYCIKKTKAKLRVDRKSELAGLMLEAVQYLVNKQQWRNEAEGERMSRELEQPFSFDGQMQALPEKGTFTYKLVQPNFRLRSDLTSQEEELQQMMELANMIHEENREVRQYQLAVLRSAICQGCKKAGPSLINLFCEHSYCIECLGLRHLQSIEQILKSIHELDFNTTFCKACNRFSKILDLGDFNNLENYISKQLITRSMDDRKMIAMWMEIREANNEKRKIFDKDQYCQVHPQVKIKSMCFSCKITKFLCAQCMIKHQKIFSAHNIYNMKQGIRAINNNVEKQQIIANKIMESYIATFQEGKKKIKTTIQSSERFSQAIDLWFDKVCSGFHAMLNDLKKYYFQAYQQAVKKISYKTHLIQLRAKTLKKSISKIVYLRENSLVSQITETIDNFEEFKDKWGMDGKIKENLGDQKGEDLIHDVEKEVKNVASELKSVANSLSIVDIKERLTNIRQKKPNKRQHGKK